MKNIIYFFLFFCFAVKAQNNTLVQIWTIQNGNQSGSFKNFTVQDNLGNTYAAGALKNNATTHDGYISKLSAQGQTIWTYNFTGTGNGDDVVLSVKFDNHKNIYLTGTTYKSATNNYDLFLVKLDKDGNLLWSETFNGTASSIDSGGDIVLDTLGNVFVVGASMNSSTLVDFVVLKYDSVGNQVWVNQYDYLGFNDAANKVILSGDSLLVSGVSQSAANNWDFATISMSSIDGNIGNEIRSGGSGNGVDKLNAITYDNSGHIYITGAVLNANNNYDARTIKLNPNLTINWSKDYNGIDSLDDESNDVKVDSIGNVYIAGYSTKTGESKNILIIKYNSLGDTIFTKLQNGLGNGHDQANAVCLGLDGSIFITGSSKNTHEDIVTVKFNPAGLPIKTQTYSGTGNGRANSISVGELGEIIISGQVYENGDYKNVTINYLENLELPDISSNQILTNGRKLSYIDKLLMVRFHPACFNMEVMDNKNIRNQTLGVFMKDTVLNLLASKIYGDNNTENIQKISKLNCSKPFYFLDSEDTLSIGRNAKEVKVPQFWATLTIYLDEELRMKDVCSSLNTMNPFVRFYDIIPKPELYNVPNDTYYQTKQKSLHFDSIYPDADINVEEAWDIEAGKNFVRVGIIDTQIDTSHADLKLTDYYNLYQDISDTTVNQNYHATRVAGIIGAKRNNNIGVAGIAGGNGNDSTGVTIFGIDILGGFTFWPQHSAVAIVLGSTQLADANEIANIFPDYLQYFYPTDVGLGLHIMNHSYGINYGSFIPNDPTATVPTTCNICHEAIEYSYRNGVVNVAARGNEFIGGYDNATDSVFPSCTKDEMILSVSSSGYNGLFKSYDNDNPDPLSSENYMSMYGRNVDIMAPGTTANVYSTDVDMSNDTYFYFNGTSAASPHAAGTAALMLSHVNRPCPCEKNLSNEDIENILQITASERDYAIVNGTYINAPDYDSYSGWGMLDAGKAIKAVEEPKNQIIHVNKQNANINSTLVAQDAIIHLYNPYTTVATGYQGSFSSMFDINQLFSGSWAMQNPSIDQSYVVDIYKVSTTIDHSNKTQHFSTNAEIKDYWIRNSNSIGWALDSCIHIGGVLVCDSIDVTQNVYFDTAGVDLNTASLFTYVYNFKHIYQDWDSVTYMTDLWYPTKPEGTEFAYSIYVHDSSATSVPFYPCTTPAAIKSNSKEYTDNCNIFPNPVSETLNMTLEIENTQQIVVAIYDIRGRTLGKYELGNLKSGKYYFDFDVSNLGSSIYFLQVASFDKIIANNKFIKL